MRFPPPIPVLFLLAGLLACEREGEIIRIGGVASVTGEAATLGTSTQKGYELAVEEWNAKGGLLGKRIRLAFADDKGDPAEGATVFTKLIEKGAVGILGSCMSKVSLAGAPIAQAAHIPMIAPSSTNPRVTQAGDYVFRACFIDSVQGTVGARFAFNDLHARKAACLFDLGNDYTKGLAEYFRSTFTGLGGQVAAFEGHPSGTSDFKAQLTKILPGSPEVLYIPDYYNDVALIARQARELGFKGALLGGDGWDSPRLTEIAGTVMEPACFTHHFAREDADPVCQRFVKSYRDRFKHEPDGLAAMGYDAAGILLEAIRRAGTVQGSAIRDALVVSEFATTSGPVRFDAERNPIKPVYVSEIKGTRPVYRTAIRP